MQSPAEGLMDVEVESKAAGSGHHISLAINPLNRVDVPSQSSRPAFQLSMTVVGRIDSPDIVASTRNRWPSDVAK